MNEIDRSRWEAKIERQSSYVDFIERTAATDPREAAFMLVTGLMRGDETELRMGYSLGSALISGLEMMERWGHTLSITDIGVLVERIAQPKDGLVEYGPTSRG